MYSTPTKHEIYGLVLIGDGGYVYGNTLRARYSWN
jgi:hypothetical protein